MGGNLDQLMSFAANRMQPRSGGDLMALLAGPGLSLNAPDNWAGPGGMGTPQGQGDWAAMVHDLPTGSSEAMYSPSPCGKERRSGRSIFAARRISKLPSGVQNDPNVQSHENLSLRGSA